MPRGMRWHNCIRCGDPVYGFKDRICAPCLRKESGLPPLNAIERIRELGRQRREERQ